MLLRKLATLVWNRIIPAPAAPEIRLVRRSSFKDLGETRAVLERLLNHNILPFWIPNVLDIETGGYRLNHNVKGTWRGPAPKSLVAQARTLWFFSRLSRSPYGSKATLAAARHGYEFMRTRMWDRDFGAFFWEVDAEGQGPTLTDKHLYGEAFALFALAEYSNATNDPETAEFALSFFELLDDRFHDPQHGGYREVLRRDWQPVPDDAPGYVWAIPAGLKTSNTHLHVMEAFAALAGLTVDRRVQDRLFEMILIQSNAILRKGSVASCTNAYQPDWTPLTGFGQDNVYYGHDLENITLLIQACAAADLPNGPLLDLYTALFKNAVHYGWDRREGGFFFHGPIGVPAINRIKFWWVQAEAMLAALEMFRLTGREVYRDCYFETLHWIDGQQADWEHGDWHKTILPEGSKEGDKASAWKTPYHNGRAVIECLALLDIVAGGAATSGKDTSSLGSPGACSPARGNRKRAEVPRETT